MIEAYLELLDLGYYEVKFAFEGLADENVWKRPSDRLLSVGELAGHVAFWHAVWLSGAGKEAESDVSKCAVTSPLVDPRFRYHGPTLEERPSEQHLAMTAEQVCGELLRVHEEAVAHFKTLNLPLDSPIPGHPPGFTYREIIKYQVFHVAYHTGQMYSVRHLLGEQPPDN